MKTRKLVALGMAGMLSLNGLLAFAESEVEAKQSDNQVVIDFEDFIEVSDSTESVGLAEIEVY